MSAYSSRANIRCPESLLEAGNHLACLLGENAADIKTFSTLSYQSATGTRYAVCSAVVKEVFLEPAETGVLPETPAHGIDIIDRTLAQQAFDSLGLEGGLMMIVGDDPQVAIQQMGLERIPEETTA